VSAVGIAFALGAALAWGTGFLAIAACMNYVEPLWTTAIRFGIALPALLIMLVILEGWHALRYEGRFWRVFATGAIGMGGYNVFGVYGIKLAGAEHAALLFATVPLMTTIVIAIRASKMPSSLTVGCILAALLGISLVITGGNFASLLANASVGGDALLLVASVTWVVYTIERGRFASWSSLRFTSLTLISGEALTLVAAFIATRFFGAAVPDLHALHSASLPLGYAGLVPVIIALLCYNAAVARLGPATAALFINFVPVVTFAVQALEGTHLPTIEYVGAAMVIAALVVNSLATIRHGSVGVTQVHAHPRIA
jgi:drug/metabolite transporter (DMT)-like permease